jgi:D-alanine transaminase
VKVEERKMGNIIFNGEIINHSDVYIDVEDRGYQFGDGVYEVIRVYNGKLFANEMHLNRLLESAKLLFIKMPFTVEELQVKFEELIAKDQLQFGIIYMQLTRGVSLRNHAFPIEEVEPVFVAYTKEMPYTGEVKLGIRAMTIEDVRWLRCNIKSLNLLGNILAKQEAVEAGCNEAVQHRDGMVTEGSSSNVAMIVNGTLKTHPTNHFILNGITRQVMLQLCKENGIPFVEEAFSVDEMLAADEVFYTSTSVEVTPIVKIDETVIGDGQIGPITRQLQTYFREEIERQCGKLQA